MLWLKLGLPRWSLDRYPGPSVIPGPLSRALGDSWTVIQGPRWFLDRYSGISLGVIVLTIALDAVNMLYYCLFMKPICTRSAVCIGNNTAEIPSNMKKVEPSKFQNTWSVAATVRANNINRTVNQTPKARKYLFQSKLERAVNKVRIGRLWTYLMLSINATNAKKNGNMINISCVFVSKSAKGFAVLEILKLGAIAYASSNVAIFPINNPRNTKIPVKM